MPGPLLKVTLLHWCFFLNVQILTNCAKGHIFFLHWEMFKYNIHIPCALHLGETYHNTMFGFTRNVKSHKFSLGTLIACIYRKL